jgi:hypothetical protein
MAHIAASDRHELEPGSPEAYAKAYFEAQRERMARHALPREMSDKKIVFISILSSVAGVALIAAFVWGTHLHKTPSPAGSTGGTHITTTTAPAPATTTLP